MKPYAALGRKFKEFIPKVQTDQQKGKPKQEIQESSRIGKPAAKAFVQQPSAVSKSRYTYENESSYQRSQNGGLLNYKGVAQNIKSVPRSEFSVFEKTFNCLQPEEFDNWMKIFHLYMEGVIC